MSSETTDVSCNSGAPAANTLPDTGTMLNASRGEHGDRLLETAASLVLVLLLVYICWPIATFLTTVLYYA